MLFLWEKAELACDSLKIKQNEFFLLLLETMMLIASTPYVL